MRASGLDAVILRPTAFMEHHAHNFNGKGLLDKGKAQLIGPGTKPRNFVCAADVAAFAVRALLEDRRRFARSTSAALGTTATSRYRRCTRGWRACRCVSLICPLPWQR